MAQTTHSLFAHTTPPQIDLMEMWGTGAAGGVSPSQSTYHYTSSGGGAPDECGSEYDEFKTAPNEFKFYADEDWADDFHIWQLRWDETTIRYYVDDVLYGTIAATNVTPVPQTPL